MRIKNIKIRNFKCLGPDEITLDFSENIIVLVGENNVGKSSVLNALGKYFSGEKSIPVDYFYENKTDHDHAVVITCAFNNLSDGDKSHKAISSYITLEDGEELWIFKKVFYYNSEGKSVYEHYAVVNGEEKQNPGGLSTNPADLFTEDKMQKIFIKAVEDIKDISDSNSKTPFSQVFSMIIKSQLEGHEKFKNLLDALKEYRELFQGTGQIPQIKNLENDINKKLSRIFPAVGKIDSDPPKIDRILPVPKFLTNDNRVVDIKPTEQGHGLQRTIIFTLLEILAERTSPSTKSTGTNNLLLVEEPEIYMHPQMERKISDTLYKIALDGETQVICTTHSPIFIKIADKHKALAIVKRTIDNKVVVTQQNEIFEIENRDNYKKKLRMITNFDPSVNEAFFAKRVVLVEGDTEIAVFREASELLGYFDSEDNKHKKRDTTFINCRGKLTINLFQEVLKHFKIDYVVIHDKDDEDFEKGKNAAILKLLENKEKRMCFNTKIEEQLGIKEENKDKPIKALEKVHSLYEEGKLEEKLGKFVKFAYNIT